MPLEGGVVFGWGSLEIRLDLAVAVKNRVAPKWNPVSGSMGQNLWSPGSLILTHTHIVPEGFRTCSSGIHEITEDMMLSP